ncbi:MAG: glycosyltransferase [Thermodesulfovibrionales bacterium]|nr:glycosyltransferase [Thermodesulfovibrionales bacterium]
MKLMMISEGYGRGGGDKVISDLSLNLPSDIETVIAAVKIDEKDRLFPYKGKLLHLPVRPTAFRFVNRVSEINKVIASEKPDAVLTFRQNYNFANILSSGRHKRIVSIHNYDDKYFRVKGLKGRINKFITSFLYNRSDYLIVLTEDMKKDISKFFYIGEDKIKVIPNPCDIEKIRSLSKEEADHPFFDTDEPIIINVGRLTRQKGQWHLIRAFGKVRRQMPCSLAIIGHGNLEPYLKKLADDLNLKNDVLFLGWQTNPYKYLSRASLFAFPSLWEGFGLSLVEAMAVGCPVISSDCKYGPREILDNGACGKLVPVCDGNLYGAQDPLTVEENMTAEAIVELLKDDGLRNACIAKANKRIADYQVEKIIKMYADVLYFV